MQLWLQILLRTISIFIIAWVLVRVMGKRNISRMTPFNFVCYIAIGVLVALISVNIITNFAFGLIATGV